MKKRILCICLLAAMCLTLLPAAASAEGEPAGYDTLTVAYYPFNGAFSPFYAATAYDQDVMALTQVSLLTTDRGGSVVTHGTGGEVIPYDGTDYTYYAIADMTVTPNEDGSVDYDFTLREDVTFSDGVALTADDVIFSMYVFCDPTYDGYSNFCSLPIAGLMDYRRGIDIRGSFIYNDGPDGYVENALYTEAQYKQFWDYYENEAPLVFVQEIIDYCVSNYAQEYGAGITGHTYEEILAEPAYQLQLAMNLWGYGYAYTGDATAETFLDAMLDAYGGDAEYMVSKEGVGRNLLQITNASDPAFTETVDTGTSAPNIAGIIKTGDYSLRVHLDSFSVTATYMLGITVAPMHYYGSEALYDYENNMFGFPKGDLSSVWAKTSQPMGAGPYKFVSYVNGDVTFEANEDYWLGAPKIRNIVFKTGVSDLIGEVARGDLDVAEPSFTDDAVDTIKSYNRNGELTGNRIATCACDNPGYGYIGINAVNVSVGDDPGSEASKNLRKALATAISLFREEGCAEYYGDRAVVINYPISNTSWAAPHPEDEGYETAFSRNVSGGSIYSAGMSADEKREAAGAAVLGFLEAAGYTVEDGRVTAAPEGAKLEYSVLIPGGGYGDHPTYSVACGASELLGEIGMTLTVCDLQNSTDLWEALGSGTAELWCAAWGSSIDPDMYQIYYSDVANASAGSQYGNPLGGPDQGASNYEYCIADPELDALILEARSISDTAARKALYRQCLDIIMDWAVEVPYYQRQNAFIFSARRVNMDTLPDMTALYGWMSEIHSLELLPFTGYELTLTASEEAAENPVTVTGITDGGEYAGTTEFTVDCGETCVVLCSRDWGETYERLPQTVTKAGHSYSVNFDDDLTIAVVKLGDVMLDGDITITDVNQIKRFIAARETFTALQIAAGDVNGDGELNTTDVTQLKRYLAGKRTFDW